MEAESRQRESAGDWVGEAPRFLAAVEELADRLGTSLGMVIAVAVAVLLALAVAALRLGGGEATVDVAAIPLASTPLEPATPTSLAAPGSVMVHAAGAVTHPGVYELAAGARVGDVLAAAGGPQQDADLDRVNLAEIVADGARIYLPRVGELQVPVAIGQDLPPTRGDGDGTGPGRVIDLNSAGPDELEALPGIGPSTAAAIIEHRERNGPFSSIDELLEVRGIGPAKLETLRPHVGV